MPSTNRGMHAFDMSCRSATRPSRRGPFSLTLLLLVPAALLSCSAPARDRVMHFFFEYPATASAPGDASSRPTSAAAPIPLLADKRIVASAHPPFVQRQCVSCHNPANAYQPPLDVCRACHAKLYEPRPFAHGPFAADACMQCHVPHASSLRKLLRVPDPDQCLRCHEMTKFPECPGRKYHVPGACTACHEPHNADRRFMLKPRALWIHLLPNAPASQPAEARP